MFNIFQYEKLTKNRLHHNEQLLKQEKSSHEHTKKTNQLSSHSNARCLEWAAKFLNCDTSKPKLDSFLQEGTVKLLDSSILVCRKPTSHSSSDKITATKQIRHMDTNILHPYRASNPPIHEKSEAPTEPLRAFPEKHKPFIQYSRSYKKNESVWSDPLISYIPSSCKPAAKSRTENPEPRKIFKLGVKNDLWPALIHSPGSVRTYESHTYLSSLPDLKLYKKSLEHLITKKLK